MVPLQQILGAKNIIDLITKIKPGVSEKNLPPEFMTVTEKVPGNYGTYQAVVGERRAARTTNYGAPAQTYEPTSVSEIPVNFLHSFQDMPINPSAMMNLLDEGNENRQRMGAMTIGRQIGDFAQTFKNLRVASIMMMLAQGKIYTDGLGRLTVDPTAAKRTINYNVPSQNTGQLPIPRYTLQGGKLVVTSAPIISAKWSTTSTNILQQLTDLKRAAALQTGYPIKHAFCGGKVKSYLFNNATYQEFMKFNPMSQQALLNSDKIPDGFADVVWHEMNQAFYTQDLPNPGLLLTPNAAIPIFPDNTVVFTPDMSDNWYELIEGSFPIPTDAIMAKDAMELLSSMEEAFGHFGFAKMGTDKQPSQIVQYQGDTFLPVIRIPYSIFIATVDF